MTRLYLSAIAGFSAILGAMPAQGQEAHRAAAVADSLQVAQAIYERMFAGIVLPDTSHQQALRVLGTAFVKQFTMEKGTDRQWQAYLGVQAQRDTTLARLIPDSAALVRFWRHSRSAIPQKPPYIKPDTDAVSSGRSTVTTARRSR